MESLVDKYTAPDFLKPFMTGEKRRPNQVSSRHLRIGDRLVPMTHADSMPSGVHAAATSAIGEIDDRQPFDLDEGQRELMARHMIHGTQPTEQELADYSMPDEIDVQLDGIGKAGAAGSNLLNAKALAAIGEQGLRETGFDGFKDDSTPTYHREAGSLFSPRFQPISPNNQKYYGHMRAPNLLSALVGEGPDQARLKDLFFKTSRDEELKEAGEIYERGKSNPLQGYDGVFSGPNYAESSLAAMADNSTLAGTMLNAADYGGRMNDSLVRRGMDMNPASGSEDLGAFGLAMDGVSNWFSGALSGGIPEAYQYANALGSARHHGLGMNPSLPGDTYEERMANRDLAARRAQLGEVEDFKELARQRGYGNISPVGEALLGIGRELLGDPTVLFGLGKGLFKKGASLADELVSEGIGEGVMSSPEVSAALFMDSPDTESMSDKDIEKARLYRRMNRQAMMNPDQSPWLKK